MTIKQHQGLSVDDVKMWALFQGIGHAVASVNSGLIHTACNELLNRSLTTEKPKRICRKCRERIKLAKPAQENKIEYKHLD